MRFLDLVDFRKPKTPGYGISKSFYLSVLSPCAQLPAPSDWISPTGPVKGFIAPLAGDKDALHKPMERGAYAVTSLDKKTVMRCLVLPREEAGFDPDYYLAHPCSQALHTDIRSAIKATWTLIQLSFEGHHPMVSPSVWFAYSIASRLAEHVGGVVADPMSEDYLCPHEARPVFAEEGPLSADQIIRVKYPTEGTAHTLGLRKFGLPELEISGFGLGVAESAGVLLVSVAQTILNNGPLGEGAVLGDRDTPFKVVPGGMDRARWDGIPCLDLLPEKTGTVDQAILGALGSRRD